MKSLSPPLEPEVTLVAALEKRLCVTSEAGSGKVVEGTGEAQQPLTDYNPMRP